MDYIQKLFTQPEHASEDEAGGWLRVSEDAAGLLEAFSESPRIELQAGWQGHRLRFPLKPRARLDTGEMTLEVGVPEVLEGGERSRSWRVPLDSDQEMRLVDQSGRLERPRVINLSYTGMAVEQAADQAPELDQALMDLRLVLPGEAEYVRLLGHVVRHTPLDEKRVRLGIRFEPLEGEPRDMLGRYILRRHKELQESAR
nr:PilZ domain-containing protein [Thiorhodococcus mannitoliphagus]